MLAAVHEFSPRRTALVGFVNSHPGGEASRGRGLLVHSQRYVGRGLTRGIPHILVGLTHIPVVTTAHCLVHRRWKRSRNTGMEWKGKEWQLRGSGAGVDAFPVIRDFSVVLVLRLGYFELCRSKHRSNIRREVYVVGGSRCTELAATAENENQSKAPLPRKAATHHNFLSLKYMARSAEYIHCKPPREFCSQRCEERPKRWNTAPFQGELPRV